MASLASIVKLVQPVEKSHQGVLYYYQVDIAVIAGIASSQIAEEQHLSHAGVVFLAGSGSSPVLHSAQLLSWDFSV